MITDLQESNDIRVLLIEDDPDAALLVRQNLAYVDVRKINLTHVFSIGEARLAILDNAFSAVILDSSLRDSHGVDTIRHVRQMLPETPIVVLTERAGGATTCASLAPCVQDFVGKDQIDGKILYHSICYAIERQRLPREVETTFAELRARKENYKNIITNTADGIIILGDGETILFMNPAAERLMNCSPEELIGTRFDYPLIDVATVEIKRNEIAEDCSVVEIRLNQCLWEGREARLVSMRDIQNRKRIEKELRQNRNMLSTLMSNLPGVVYRCRNNRRWTMEFVSDGVVEMTGYTRDDLVHDAEIAYNDLIQPDDREDVWHGVQEAVRNQRPFSLQYRLRRADGEERWILNIGRLSLNGDDDHAALEGFMMDISERIRNDERLRLQAAALEAAANGIVITDIDGNIVWVNPAFTKLTGHSCADVKGCNARLLNSGKHPRSFHQSLWKTILRGKVWQGELINKRRDGSLYTEEMTITPFHDNFGQLTYFIAVKQDISDRKAAEASIHLYSDELEKLVKSRTNAMNLALEDAGHSKDRARTILQSVADAVIVTEADGRVSMVNQAAVELFGVSSEHVVNRPIAAMTTNRQVGDILSEIVTRRPESLEFNLSTKAAEKDARVLRARTSLIIDETGKEDGVITLIQDVTREREIERLRNEFITTAAHELRTPLTSILGFSEILRDRNDLSADQRGRFVSHIHDQSLALEKIINDLLNITRIESETRC